MIFYWLANENDLDIIMLLRFYISYTISAVVKAVKTINAWIFIWKTKY